MSGDLAGSTAPPKSSLLGHHHRRVKRQRIEEEEPPHSSDDDEGSELLPERKVKFILNGEEVDKSCSLTRPLAWTLRETFGLHGTKVACGQGNCGACTILVKYPDQEDAKPVNGCLFATGSLLVSDDSNPCNMFEVTTIEGIASKDHEHFADAIVETNGTQCGFCTAGMIMKVAGSAPKKGCSKVGDIEDLFNGNLCRCTGYRPIVYAAKKTYLSEDNLRLKEENALSPPCVVRGDDRDYSKTYANRSLSHPNVQEDVPLESEISPSSDVKMRGVLEQKQVNTRGRSINLGDEVVAVNSKFKSMRMKPSKCLLSKATREEWHDNGPSEDAQVVKRSEWRHFSNLDDLWNAVLNSTATTSVRVVAGNANHAWNRLDDAADSEAVMFVSILGIKDLTNYSLGNNLQGVRIGAAVTLSTFNDEVLKKYCPAAASHLDTVANIQVRNFGTIGGNLAAARIYHKTSDIGLILSALNATIEIQYCIPSQKESKKIKTVPIWNFLTSNKDDQDGALLPPECVWLITAINLDLSEETLSGINPYFARVARRIQNHPSLASVAATATEIIVTEAHCPKDFAIIWKCDTSSSSSAEDLYTQIKKEDMDSEYFKDEAIFRLIFHLAVQAKILRFPTLLSKRIEEGQVGSQKFLIDIKASPVTEPTIKPNAYDLRRGDAVYTQDVQKPRDGLDATFILSPVARLKFDTKAFRDVGQAMVDAMVGTGTAIFLTAEAMSLVAESANNRSSDIGISTSDTPLDFLKMNGDDSERFDKPQPFGEFVMASGTTGSTFCGQPIAMVLHPELTESRRLARHVQGLVDLWKDKKDRLTRTLCVEIEDPILDLQYSIDNSALKSTRLPSIMVGRGEFLDALDTTNLDKYMNVEESVAVNEWIWDWKNYKNNREKYLVVESATVAPSQTHLYLETQTAMCTETQKNVFDIHASTQSASSIQAMAAKLLGVPHSHVTVKNNLLGGGFGGKEPQSVPEGQCGYRVCIDKESAMIVAMDLVLDGDAGASENVSGPVLELAAFVSDNAYGIKNFMCRATPYLTNKLTGTAFRSFGVVQTIQLTETAIQHAWDAVHQTGLSDISAPAFRRKHFSDRMSDGNIPRAHCSIHQRLVGRIMVKIYARNQGNARVAIYSQDGSVLVDHSGIEMGQGLISRATVACAAELGVPMHFVRVGSFNTYSTPNAPGTGASTGTALSIPGVVQAAHKLRTTLTKLVDKEVDKMLKSNKDSGVLIQAWRNDPDERTNAVNILNTVGKTSMGEHWETSADAKNPWALYTFLGDSWRIPVLKDETIDEAQRRNARQNDMWTTFVSSAYSQRKSLIKLGYSTPNADGNLDLSAVNIFYYFNYAAAFSCVELIFISLNVENSHHLFWNNRSCGLSHNPAIDIGQVEGGFVQGLGNMLTESVTYDDTTGALVENSIMNYAIPDHRSIPQEFNVILTWEGGSKAISAEDSRTIQQKAAKVQVDKISRSKSTGEPPLVLGSTVLFAARNAVRAARRDHLGQTDWLVNFQAPLLPPNMLEAIWGDKTCLDSRHNIGP
eukprot:scaffold95573_cov54-Attheya_sp.AAC.1